MRTVLMLDEMKENPLGLGRDEFFVNKGFLLAVSIFSWLIVECLFKLFFFVKCVYLIFRRYFCCVFSIYSFSTFICKLFRFYLFSDLKKSMLWILNTKTYWLFTFFGVAVFEPCRIIICNVGEQHKGSYKEGMTRFRTLSD